MTIAFIRVLRRSEFFEGWKLREEALSSIDVDVVHDASGGTQYDRAFQVTSLFTGGGGRWPSRTLVMVPLAEVRFKKRGSHGCERQIRLRRADPSLGSLSRPRQVAATARNVRAGGTDCGLLVQRELWRIRRPLPAELGGRTAVQTSDFSVGRAPRGRTRARRDQHRHPGAPEDRRRARRH